MEKISEYVFSDLSVGLSEKLSVTFTDALLENFASLTGDRSPLHQDASYAQGRNFKGVVVHGCLVSSFLSTLVGMKLPGKNALFLSQNIEWPAPVYVGDRIDYVVTISDLSAATRVCQLRVSAHNQMNEVVCRGRLVVKVLS